MTMAGALRPCPYGKNNGAGFRPPMAIVRRRFPFPPTDGHPRELRACHADA